MKRIFPSCVLALFVLVEPVFSAEPPSETNSATSGAATKSSKVPPLPEIVIVKDKAYEEIDAYMVSIGQLFKDSRFDELEMRADKARTTKYRYPVTAGWQIQKFYVALDLRKKDPDSTWQNYDDILKKWIAAKPQSVTARVAQAGFFTGYAWRARSDGYANTVTEEGWSLFRERLERAQAALTAAQKLQPKCPMWWRNQMVVAIGMGWDRARFDRLFAEAKAFEPMFVTYDIRRAQYLLPRWHGEPGDWEAAAEKEITRPGLGLEAYALVVQDQIPYYKNVFRDSKASWPKTRDGYELMRRKYPGLRMVLHEYAQLACMAGDRATAQKLLAEIDGQIDTTVWYSKENFLRYWTWAYDEGATEAVEYN